MTVTHDYAASGWLQAFIGTPDPALQQLRLFSKKQIDSVDVLSNLSTIREKASELDGILEQLWAYAKQNELIWLLQRVPATQPDWELPMDDQFTIHCVAPPKIDSPQDLSCALGIRDWSTRVMLRILRSDFATWQRKVSRVGSGAPIGFTVTTSEAQMMELPSVATWTANQWVNGVWKISIDGQPNMNAILEEPIHVKRPELRDCMDDLTLAIEWADSNLRKIKNSPKAESDGVPSWIPMADPLYALHDTLYLADGQISVTRSFRTTWEAVWPVIYCRRRKLVRGHCEMQSIRRHLDHAFETEPNLVAWTFFLGEMLSQIFLGDGIGISAKYRV
jgi:hypothetical protein